MRSGCPGANRILGAWPLPITFRRHFFGREVLLDLLSASGVRWLWEKGKGRSEKGKERGSAARLSDRRQRERENRRRLPRAISAAIREDFGTKTEVSHDGASFLRSVAGCFSVARRIPRSAHRPIRGRPTTRGFPVGYLGFRAKICLGGCTISDSPAIPIRKSNLPFRAFALPVYYRKRLLMAIALQFFVCLAISMLPRVSR